MCWQCAEISSCYFQTVLNNCERTERPFDRYSEYLSWRKVQHCFEASVRVSSSRCDLWSLCPEFDAFCSEKTSHNVSRWKRLVMIVLPHYHRFEETIHAESTESGQMQRKLCLFCICRQSEETAITQCLTKSGQMRVGWVLHYVHRNRRLIRDWSPGRPPRLSQSSWAVKAKCEWS